MATTISVAIQKGGSGKTTTSINLAAALQQAGKSILLVDMDPQANLTQSLGLVEEPEPNIYHLLHGESRGKPMDIKNVIRNAHGIDLISSSLDLATAELELVSTFGREQMLKKVLNKVEDQYDFILIDCPPSVGMLTVNALVASQEVLLPMQAEYLPYKGLKSFMRSFEMVKTQLNPDLDILGIVLTKYEQRKKMTRRIEEKLKEEFPDKVFSSHIRNNIALAKAQEQGKDIFSFDRGSNGAFDYIQLTREFLEKVEN